MTHREVTQPEPEPDGFFYEWHGNPFGIERSFDPRPMNGNHADRTVPYYLTPPAPKVPEGWKEATIAWEVCASVHRQWAIKKDALFTTRQADFVRHAEHARKMFFAAAPEYKETP